MRALTVTFSGVEHGIQTQIGRNDMPAVVLGMPDKDGRQSQVPLDLEHEPVLDEVGRVHDAVLIRTEGRRGFTLARDINGESPQSLLLRLTTEGIPNSGVSVLGNEVGKLQVKGSGCLDPNDRRNTTWADSLHTLDDGKAVELIDRQTNSGLVVINAAGEAAPMRKSDFSHLSSRSLMPAGFIDQMLEQNPLLSDAARQYLRQRSARYAANDNPYRAFKRRSKY